MLKIKKLVFACLLILFLVGLGGWGVVKRVDLSLDFSPQPLIEPLGAPSKEEELTKKLAEVGLVPESLIFDKEEVVASFSAGPTVLFSASKDLRGQVASLQFILSRTKIEGKIPLKIDLRFEKPILKY